jgi:uncharacterized protein (DUF4415 family)
MPLFPSERIGDSPHFGPKSDTKGTSHLRTKRKAMRKEYDFSKLKGRKNPYAKQLKKQITIRVGVDVLEYFKQLAEETGIPYQNLINLYLRDCVISGRRPAFKWS